MAANTTYIIYDTAGAAVTAIQPNTLNGPGGVQQSSDLRMYGLGFPNWGEGVNENDYHIVENFACPESILNPGNPMGSAELGDSNGINTPLVGQNWFNTTTQAMYVYTEPSPSVYAWKPIEGISVATGSMPVSPSTGELWYDSSVPQLKIYDGSSFVSVAAQYLPLSGGTLSGPIALSGNKITGVGTPTASQDVANKQYVDNAITGIGSIYLPTAGGTMTGTLTMSSAAITMSNANLSMTNGQLIFTSPPSGVAINAGAGRVSNVGSPTAGTDAITRDFADLNYLKTSGGTMSGAIAMGTNKITGLGTPTNSTDATTKNYVDTTFAPLSGFAYSPIPNGYQKFPTGFTNQWGTTTAIGGTTTVITYPTPFNVFSVAVCSGDDGSADVSVYVIATTATNFTVRNVAGASATIRWVAMGF